MSDNGTSERYQSEGAQEIAHFLEQRDQHLQFMEDSGADGFELAMDYLEVYRTHRQLSTDS
jgi:hypothetical protein